MGKIQGLIQTLRNARVVYKGFHTLNKTKQTPHESYVAMRNLFVATNGRSNDVISRMVRTDKYRNIPFEGILGLKSKEEVAQVVADIQENGFHVFDQKLPDNMIAAITQYAAITPARYIPVNASDKEKYGELVRFDEQHPISPRYNFSQQQILECEPLQTLIFDTSVLAVAQEYLGTKPLLDLMAMWWSAPFHGAAKSEAAQMYHFDLDRIKFIKFFFYLTDVDANTGPHCYVRKSHKRLPPSLLKDGRLTDAEVEATYGKENMLELCGRRGTIMAVDTRGLHKGKDLTEGKRLIFQIEFANSMFGQYYPPCKRPALKPELEAQFQRYKESYQEIMA